MFSVNDGGVSLRSAQQCILPFAATNAPLLVHYNPVEQIQLETFPLHQHGGFFVTIHHSNITRLWRRVRGFIGDSLGGRHGRPSQCSSLCLFFRTTIRTRDYAERRFCLQKSSLSAGTGKFKRVEWAPTESAAREIQISGQINVWPFGLTGWPFGWSQTGK